MDHYHSTGRTMGLVASHRRRILTGAEYDHFFITPQGNNIVLSGSASVFDTLDSILNIVSKTLSDTTKIAAKLKRGKKEDSCKAIFDFAYNHIQYEKDKDGVEQVRRPARSWADRKTGIDCDCFSVFVGSILTNLKIPFYFRIIKRNYATDYSHIYIVVPKNKKFNLQVRNDYYVIDPVLDKFDKEADSITQKFDKMGGITLEYLDGLSEAKTFGQIHTTFGTEFNGLDGLGDAQVAGKLVSGIKQHLVNTRRMIDHVPSNGLYNKDNFRQALTYALANWDDPVKRDNALELLSKQDDKIMNVQGINGFCGLSGVEDQITDMLLGGCYVGRDGALHGLGLQGGFFAKVKNVVKNTTQKVVTVAKKASVAVATVAKKVGKAILKYNPLSVSIRLGMLMAAELNFAGISKKLMWGYTTLAQAKAKGISEDTWNRSKSALASVEKLFVKALKGEASALQKAVLGGKRKAATGLGNPAALAPAMAFIVKVGTIINKAFAGAKNIKEVIDTGSDALKNVTEAKSLLDFSTKNPTAADEFDENADYVDDTTVKSQAATGLPPGGYPTQNAASRNPSTDIYSQPSGPAVYTQATVLPANMQVAVTPSNVQVAVPGVTPSAYVQNPTGNDPGTAVISPNENIQNSTAIDPGTAVITPAATTTTKSGGAGIFVALAALAALLFMGKSKGKAINGTEETKAEKTASRPATTHKSKNHKKKVVKFSV